MNKKITLSALIASACLSGYAQECEQNTCETSWMDRESLFIEGASQKYLADTGFTPYASLAIEGWGIASGGIDSGNNSLFDSLLTVGFEQDLSALTKTNNLGTIGMSFFYYTQNHGDGLSGLDAGSDPSNIFSSEMTRVFEIYYANSLETEVGTFSVRVGQLAADEDFMGMDYSDIFLNSSFGAMPAVASIGNDFGDGFSQYSVATLGITLAYEVENFDFILGIYNGNVGEDDGSANHGFDYKLQDMALWYQAGYNYELAGKAGRVQVGGNYHNGTFDTYDGQTAEGFYSFYLGLQQDIVADQEGNAVLGGFVRAGFAPNSKISEEESYIDLGINWFGPLPGRDDDVLALGYSLINYNKNFAPDHSSASMIELTYACKLTENMAFQPTAQVYFNNGAEDKTAYVIGARFEVNF